MKVQLTGILAGHTLLPDGTVIQDSTDCQLKQWDQGEYKSVCINGFTTMVHNLMGRIYLVDSYVEGFVVNHKDYNKHNNHYENLEWISRADNTRHGRLSCNRNLIKQASYIPKKRQIIVLDASLNEMGRYNYISEVEDILGIKRKQVSKVITLMGKGEIPLGWIKKHRCYIVWEGKVDFLKNKLTTAIDK